MRRLMWLLAAVGCVGWESPETRHTFDTGDLTVHLFPNGALLTTDTTFRGEIVGGGMAPVEGVRLLGEPATSLETNFRTWSVALTHDQLKEAAVDGTATLCARATLLFAGPVHTRGACIDVVVGDPEQTTEPLPGTGTGTGTPTGGSP